MRKRSLRGFDGRFAIRNTAAHSWVCCCMLVGRARQTGFYDHTFLLADGLLHRPNTSLVNAHKNNHDYTSLADVVNRRMYLFSAPVSKRAALSRSRAASRVAFSLQGVHTKEACLARAKNPQCFVLNLE